MSTLTDPFIWVGVGQLISLAGIFIRLGRVFEKSETNRKFITEVRDRLNDLEKRI